MPQELPLRADVDWFAYSVELDGTTYGFEYRWNERAGDAGAWFLTLSDASGSVLVAGRRLVVDFPLLSRFRSDSRLPPGLLLGVDVGGASVDPGRDALGVGFRLLYYTAAEMQVAAGTSP